MKTHRLVSTFALALAVAPVASCSTDPGGDPDGTLHCNNEQSLLIAQFAPVNIGNGCVANTMGTTSLSAGILDTGIIAGRRDKSTLGYWLAPVVQNNLIDVSTSTSGQRNNVELAGFNVEARSPVAGVAPVHYYVPAPGGLIPPAGGRAAAVAQVIPAALALKLGNGRVLLRIQPVGTRGGSFMYGSCVEFPVISCNLCLTAVDASGAAIACGNGLDSTQIVRGGCHLGADDPVTCCTPDGAATLLCGPEVPVKTM